MIRRDGAALLAIGALLGLPRPAFAQDDSVPRGSSGAIVKPPPEEQAPKPVISEPVLIDRVKPEYPADVTDGRNATVVLKLTIDKDGHVSNAEVVESGSKPFDEAARDAALKYRFSPATRDGKPIAAKVLARFEFVFEPPPTTAVAPPTGNLVGRLRIADSDAPAVGADVVLTGADGVEHHLSTDEAGTWQFKNLLPGPYKVHVALPGFEVLDSKEEVTAGEETDVTLRLKPVSEGLEVVVRGERPAREVTRRTIERREIERVPGTGGDALRALQSLPGVGKAPGIAGLLIVRGSAPQDTATFVDGTAVPIIYHFLGLTSVFPTELIERIDYYPGNFSARYGRLMGGVVDVGFRAPNTQCYDDDGKIVPGKKNCVHGMAQMDFIDQRLMVEGPLPIEGWSFIAAGRKSWIDQWLKPALKAGGSSVTTAPVYFDYQLLAEHKTAHTRTSLRFYGSDDKVALIINDPNVEDPTLGGSLSFGTAFYRAQAVYEADLSSRINVRTDFSVGKDAINFNLGNFRFHLASYPIQLRNELGYRLFEGVKFNAGLDYQAAPFDVFVRAPDPPRPGEPDPGPFAARPPREVHNKGNAFRPGWYGEFELEPTDRLRLVPGLRIDYARDTGHTDVSPRVSGRYVLVKGYDADHPDRRKTALKAGVGVYDEPPQFQETDTVFGTPHLHSNRAIHYSVGVEQELTPHIEASVEGFYKDLTGQVARAPNDIGTYVYNNLGTGYVIGAETFIKYKPDDHFFGWIAYTLSRSVRRDGPGLPEYLFQYDQTHNLTVLGSYRLGRGWEFGARFTLVSGPLDTPSLLQSDPGALPALYAADAGTYAKLEGAAYTRRLPLRHQLDVRLDKRWQLKKVKMSVYLDIQNVYNHAPVEGYTYNYNFAQTGYQTSVPIIPSLGFRVEI